MCFETVKFCISTVGTEELLGFLHMFSEDYTSYGARLEPE